MVQAQGNVLRTNTIINFMHPNKLLELTSPKQNDENEQELQGDHDEDDNSSIGPLGKYAFPSNRTNVNPELPWERDTDIEVKLRKAIKNYIITNTALTARSAGVLRDILDSGMYDDVFKPAPAGTAVYRGVVVSSDWLVAHGVSEEELRASGENVGKKRISIDTSRRGDHATSWTTDVQTAVEFAKDRAFDLGAHVKWEWDSKDSPEWLGKNFCVVFEAAVEDPTQALMFDPGIYDLDFVKGQYDEESEVLMLSSPTVSSISWWPAWKPKVQAKDIKESAEESCKQLLKEFSLLYASQRSIEPGTLYKANPKFYRALVSLRESPLTAVTEETLQLWSNVEQTHGMAGLKKMWIKHSGCSTLSDCVCGGLAHGS